MFKIGYARISAADREENREAQLRDLKAAGCCERNIYLEQAPSSAARSELARILTDILNSGDVLVATTIDRIARSIVELVMIIDQVRMAGAELHILELGSTDATTAAGEVLVRVLGIVARFEWSIMRVREGDGTAKAKANANDERQLVSNSGPLSLADDGAGKTEIDRMEIARQRVTDRSAHDIFAIRRWSSLSLQTRPTELVALPEGGTWLTAPSRDHPSSPMPKARKRAQSR
jgi:DNA invertase Pin-like site-specific DNA recombinase